MKVVIVLVSIVFISFFTLSFQPGPKVWEVPEKYQKMKNPIPSSASSIKIGKDMYVRYCKSCHGTKGKGEGTQAVKQNMTTGDFTTIAFTKETDGAVFYKMTEGHNEMPSIKKKIPGSDDIIEGSFGETGSVGDLINYIRTLATKK
jgi:mono/diheme cytochrome c family protein